MKQKSIKRWSTRIFTAILLVSLGATAGWDYYWTNRSAFKQADQNAGICTETVRELLDEWELDELRRSSETELYRDARKDLRMICQRYRLDYLYVYTIDPQTNLRHYVLCVASDDENDELVQDERFLGAVSDDPLDQAEQAIMRGEVKLQRDNLVTRFGSEVIWLLPYLDKEGALLAIIGADYSVQMEEQEILDSFLLGTVPIFIALVLGFLFQLFLLRRRITDPILAISDSMHRFAMNSRVKPEPLGIRSEDEIGKIAASYEKMTEEISTYIANIEDLTRDKVQNDVQLDIARRIQYGLVPEKTDLSGSGFAVSAYTRPARAVGGDFYDCFMRDEKTVCVVMGDVSGKGISAAIFMAVAKTMIRDKLKACLSPAHALNEVNDELCRQNPEGLFATVFAASLDTGSGRLTYANAGHTHPVILGPDPYLLVPDSGIALGLFEDAGLENFELNFKPGEGILLYTDGITEAVNPEKVFFGEERLLKVLSDQEKDRSGSEREVHAVINQVSDALVSFRRGEEPFDDAALLALLQKDSPADFLPIPVANSSFEEVRKTVFAYTGDTPAARQILLACDEALANIVNYSNADSLEFACRKEGEDLIVVFSDNGIPFDPTAEDPLEKDFDFLDSGGMGLSMIRQIVSSFSYERKDGRNELTLRFSDAFV